MSGITRKYEIRSLKFKMEDGDSEKDGEAILKIEKKCEGF